MKGFIRCARLCLGAGLVVLSAQCGRQRPTSQAADAGTGDPLRIEIQSADVPASGSASVTFRLIDGAGNPIDDLSDEIANDAAQVPQGQPRPTPRMTPHFTLAQLEADGTYTSYFEVTVQGQAFTSPSGASAAPASTSAVQPRTEPTSPFPTDRLEAQGGGVYRYTFSAPTTPAGKLDRSLTHTVGMYATRTVLTEPGEQANSAHATFNFIPAGGGAAFYEPVVDSACNACHGVLSAHDQRTGTQLCITCHAADRATPYSDPDSGNSLDFKVMVHKIHRGADLPSVVEGSPYFIVGFRGSVSDFSDVGFPQDLRNCTTCHQGQNAQAHLAKPTVAACTACHDNVRFDGSGTVACGPNVTKPCDHKGGPVGASAICNACHTPGEVAGMHQVPEQLAQPNFRFLIQGVTFSADRKPTVAVQVVNPQTGAPYQLTGTPDDPWAHVPDSRLAVDLGWPSSSYSNAGSGASYGQPISLDVLKNGQPVAGQPGVFQVTSAVAVPAEVNDVTVALEGHPAVPDLAAAGKFLRVPVTNDLKYVAVSGGEGAQRRQVVSVDKCNVCHKLLSAHGANRTGNTQVCVVCHNPDATDKGQRTAAKVSGEASIDFKVLIHEVHAADVRQNPVEIIGFGGSKNEFPIAFPGDTGNCNICHLDSTWALPPPPESRDTTVDTGADPASAADNVRIGATMAVCTSCHDTVVFDGSAPQQCGAGVTGPCNHRGGVGSQESTCANCHAPGQVADVAKEHPLR